jgi:hypothetical protein
MFKSPTFSPPHGSPKPAARRKNKPAPVPPATAASPKDPPPPPSGPTPEKPEKPPRPAVGPVSSTLPRPNKKHSKEYDGRTAVSGADENVSPVATEKNQKSNDNNMSSGTRKQSTDGLEHQENCVVSSSMHRRLSIDEGEKVCAEKSDEGNESESPMEQQSQILPSATVLGTTTVTVLSGCAGKVPCMPESLQQKNILHPIGGCSTLEKKHPQRPIPVAAPRSTVNINASSASVTNREVQSQSFENKPSENVCSASSRISSESTKDVDGTGGHDSVVLRRPFHSGTEHSNKPAVPERPATLLRPHNSFRGSRHSADSDSSSDKPNADVSIDLYFYFGVVWMLVYVVSPVLLLCLTILRWPMSTLTDHMVATS